MRNVRDNLCVIVPNLPTARRRTDSAARSLALRVGNRRTDFDVPTRRLLDSPNQTGTL